MLQLQLKAEKLVDRAVELTTGNQSQLTKLIQSGDVSRAVQLAKAAIVAVDVDKKALEVTQDQLKEKRKAVFINVVLAFVEIVLYCICSLLESLMRKCGVHINYIFHSPVYFKSYNTQSLNLFLLTFK